MVQKYVDASISKTVNAPNSHSVEEVKKLYNMAYELGCKGVTYFRDGSRKGVLSKVEDANDKEKDKEPNGKSEHVHTPWIRPTRVNGATYKLKTPVGTAFVTINQDENGNPFEVFINIGKAGSEVAAMAEGMGRVISKSLKFNGNLTPRERALVLVDQLKGIGGRTSVGFGPNKIRSLPDAISIALGAYCGFGLNGNGNPTAGLNDQSLGVGLSSAKTAVVAEEAGISGDTPQGVVPHDPSAALTEPNSPPNLELFPAGKKHADLCPSCGRVSLVYEEGCAKCYSCGHSEC
jgi:ribonucleoside-diphosphate reductase alpha chain